MRLTWKDGVATVLFGALAVVYGFYLAWGGISFIQDSAGNTSLGILDPTGMAAVGLLVGIVAAFVGGWVALGAGTVTRYVTAGLGLLSLALGVLALVGENLFNNATLWESVLGAFMASIALLWGIATVRHAGLAGSGATEAPRPRDGAEGPEEEARKKKVAIATMAATTAAVNTVVLPHAH